MPETIQHIDLIKKKLLPVFKLKHSSRSKILFPIYGRGTGTLRGTNRAQLKNWYYVFLNRTDCIWYIEGNDINCMQNRPDFYQSFLRGDIKEITFTEFDAKIVKFFKKVYSFVETSTEVWKEWVGLSVYYFFRNDEAKTELVIRDNSLKIYSGNFSAIEKNKIGTDMFQFSEVNTEEMIDKAVERITKKINEYQKYFSPSQIGYTDFIANKKQIPREK